MSSLFPGYKQVDSFGPDDDYDEEEVCYVTLDLGSVEPTLVPSSSTYRLIGLDTPTPFLQLSGTILKGKHETLLGSELLFTDGKDPADPSKKAVTHVANTSQRVCFREVRLQPKDAAPTPSSSSKGKAKEPPLDGLVAESEAASNLLDRVTGKNAPRTRASRSRGSASASKPKRKGKGKAKAAAEDEEEDEDAMDVDDREGNGDDDAYVP
ncbi:hypothetical protein H0H92_016153 [Tricholoma furcatifolium]|nr:hypothetical protein H0H92_016153 [Tricholoma furcatifolium]